MFAKIYFSVCYKINIYRYSCYQKFKYIQQILSIMLWVFSYFNISEIEMDIIIALISVAGAPCQSLEENLEKIAF